MTFFVAIVEELFELNINNQLHRQKIPSPLLKTLHPYVIYSK